MEPAKGRGLVLVGAQTVGTWPVRVSGEQAIWGGWGPHTPSPVEGSKRKDVCVVGGHGLELSLVRRGLHLPTPEQAGIWGEGDCAPLEGWGRGGDPGLQPRKLGGRASGAPGVGGGRDEVWLSGGWGPCLELRGCLGLGLGPGGVPKSRGAHCRRRRPGARIPELRVRPELCCSPGS